MRLPPALLLSALAALLLPACMHHEATITYLTLSETSPDHRHRGRNGPPIVIDEVVIPTSIDRQYLTASNGADTLEVSSTARWSGPLGELIRSTLARDLAARLSPPSVLLPGDPVPPGGARHLRLVFARFLPDASGRAAIEADWSLLDRTGRTISGPTRFRLSLPGPPNPGAEAATLSAALGRLADSIASALPAGGS